jgi:tRNA threonylcarbamoyl adenosine modification protein YeaZ
MIDDVLHRAEIGFDDLDAIGVGIGPGNFTGIRISVSAARGLALALGVPAVGVSLFDALALDAEDVPLLLSLKASRERVFLQHRTSNSVGEIVVARIDALPEILPETLCIGELSEQIAMRAKCRFGPAAFAPASAVARLAAERWEQPHPPPAPLYVRPADAVPPSDPPPVILPDDP